VTRNFTERFTQASICKTLKDKDLAETDLMARALPCTRISGSDSHAPDRAMTLPGGEMVKVCFRILLLLAVIAVGRAVVSGFLPVDEPQKVLLVVVTEEGSNAADSREQ